MKIQGNNFVERSNFQLDNWVLGNSIHNDVDGECCPDFSCCEPRNLQPVEIRKTFAIAHYQKREDITMPMLMSFLGAGIEYMAGEKKVHILGEELIGLS